jgi:predicted lipid-binding transport protein (Tim44 family)
MFWAGGLMGAIFGLAGIFAAACLYLFYALIKLVFLLAAFAAQLIFAISGLIARAIIYAYRRFSQRTPTAIPTKSARSPRATARKSKAIPDGLKPKRKRRSAAR